MLGGTQWADVSRGDTAQIRLVMCMTANGAKCDEGDAAQPEWPSSCRAVEPRSCCSLNARGASLLDSITSFRRQPWKHQTNAALVTYRHARFKVRIGSRCILDAAIGRGARVCRRSITVQHQKILVSFSAAWRSKSQSAIVVNAETNQ